MLAELITLAAHHLRDLPPKREQAARMLELAKTSPAVLAAFLADLERFQNRLTDIVARRQGMRPNDEIPALIAALALTAVRSGIERWSSGEATMPTPRRCPTSSAPPRWSTASSQSDLKHREQIVAWCARYADYVLCIWQTGGLPHCERSVPRPPVAARPTIVARTIVVAENHRSRTRRDSGAAHATRHGMREGIT